MAIIDWLTGLGTSGALRNTSRVLAERRLAEQRVDALVRRLEPAASRDPRRAA
jgi:Flp pilus assembly protein TadB